jgi:hypothetical protein
VAVFALPQTPRSLCLHRRSSTRTRTDRRRRAQRRRQDRPRHADEPGTESWEWEGVTILWQTPSRRRPCPAALFRDEERRVPLARDRNLAVDSNRVAVTTSGAKDAVAGVLVWTVPGRRSRSFKTGEGCVRATRVLRGPLALGGGRVAWVGNTGSSYLELHLLVAKLSGKAARRSTSAPPAQAASANGSASSSAEGRSWPTTAGRWSDSMSAHPPCSASPVRSWCGSRPVAGAS